MDEKTIATIPTDAGHKKLFDDSIVLLGSVRSSLADLLREVCAGNAGALKELVTKQSDLEAALRRAFETEQKFNDWFARQKGEDAPGDIDFDALRHEIGCRLARLSACCHEG